MTKTLRQVMEENDVPEVIHLQNPMLVNGKQLTELPIDPDGVTCELYFEAGNQLQPNERINRLVELDYQLHFWMGAACVIAANSDIAWEDFKQLRGADPMQLTQVGRFFVGQSAQFLSADSDEQSASTPTSSQPASTESGDGASSDS